VGDLIGHAVLTVVLVIMLALATAVAILPRVTGSVPLTVLTGSMQPTFNPGDLVIVRPTATQDLNLGDVVTFQPISGDPTLVTHRIIEIQYDANGQATHFITQGDANPGADQPLQPEQIKGRVWYSVPFIGYLTNTRNVLLAVSALGVGLVVYAVVMIFKTDDDNQSSNPQLKESHHD
jgi:signal peptidase